VGRHFRSFITFLHGINGIWIRDLQKEHGIVPPIRPAKPEKIVLLCRKASNQSLKIARESFLKKFRVQWVMTKFSATFGLISCFAGFITADVFAAPAPSIARIWDEEILAAIRIDTPNPPVHARNLFHLDTAMYDCWAAYDTKAIGYLHHERLSPESAEDVEQARREAISYAAYRLLRWRYSVSANAAVSLAAFDARMDALGYDKGFTNTIGNTPAALGNRVAADVIRWGLADGSNEAGGYSEPDYVNPQPPMIVLSGGEPQGFGIPFGTDPNRWQPLAFDGIAFGQNGLIADKIQKYLGATWLWTLPFAQFRGSAATPWIDPGPPSRLGTGSDAAYKAGALELIRASAQLDSDEMVDMSPGAIGNNSLGADDGTGYKKNPVTGQPYEPNLVRMGDYARVMAEFWADGPNSETPPGHWHVLANQVADNPLTIKRIGGAGPVVNDLEWDVKTYFGVSAAVHDAACVAWGLKRYYEGVRPITMIRFMASLGQSSDPKLPSYNPYGLPLEPGLVELVTEQTAAPGGPHENVGWPGAIAVFSWPGEPDDRQAGVSAVKWIPGVNWVPYQRESFVTPSFPGYVSGHSAFSRAAAEVMTAITGSAFFPGGLVKMSAEADSFLSFERGPTRRTELQWATYYDAADLAGRSRRWGGIHVPEDDYAGRIAGSQAGIQAWELAQKYFTGSISQSAAQAALATSAGNQVVTVFGAVRGLYYHLESSVDLLQWTPASEPLQATDQVVRFSVSGGEKVRFYRSICEMR
jgi:hypothetical protein